MKLFGKKKEAACSCGGSCTPENRTTGEKKKNDKGIKILGSGCAKCMELEKATRSALAELNLALDIEHVTDFAQIAGYGVMSTPALVWNGKVLSYGKVLTTDEIKKLLKKPRVAFICVHNSCRSQIAEALGKHLASDVFESYSAGTETKPQINPDAVRIMKDLYGIDMEATQYSKLLSEIPPVDIVITMGCNVSCPNLPCRYREDWGLADPTGKSDREFQDTIQSIHAKILALADKISAYS